MSVAPAHRAAPLAAMPSSTADIRRYLQAAAPPPRASTLDANNAAARHEPARKRRRPQDFTMPADPVKRRCIRDLLPEINEIRSRYFAVVADKYASETMVGESGYSDVVAEISRRSAPTAHFSAFLQLWKLDPEDEEENLQLPLTIPDANVGSGGRSATAELSPYKTSAVIAVATRPQTLLYDASIGNQELIAERVKQEAYVAARISELQREGLWAEKRLPKVQEPPRSKAHWDYLLEEMTWLSADFAQERKWKKANAKKCAKMVQKYFLDKEALQRKEEKSQELKLRRIANFIAKEVKNFWANVNKLVEYKQTTRLEEKRKQALDQHLSFIVDQTERYSTWLTESMNKPGTSAAATQSRPCSPTPARTTASDDEFCPDLSSSDDEATIAKEEDERDADEVERLRNESEMPLDDLLDSLPKDYFLNRDKDLESTSTKSDDGTMDDAAEEGDKDKTKEGRSKSVAEPDSDNDETASESEESDLTDSEKESVGSPEDDISLKTLLESKLNKEVERGDQDAADKEFNDVTALAESIQPKGSTLQTTSVATTVPFLIKHPLREYQHIGLDWLVTMFDRKLNGILADEMGLGKTIQTISLLSHLACDKGNWGPHLIVVPTSVMLNWEMEFKKWCPAFKILTYYGSIRERKSKRTGWTKDNAFHICITSYKLVIQDHASFRRKKWQYLVLDEAQNIKNFRSQRWQLLLNFQTARRLLLTGTPLQNNLMELWSLMHFLMPNVFQSHREFKEWFSNPVTGMLEGNSEYNENIIKRLHKVLRPFLLRRLKAEVEKQLPKKYEHVVMCRLSKRQRYLYDDFMSRAKTKETLESGNLLSVINVLMQLRKVCNHPNLFEVRPIISPFQMEGLVYHTASLVTTPLEYDPDRHVNLDFLNLRLADAESMTALEAFMTWRQRARREAIEELDALTTTERPRPPKRALHLNINNSSKRIPVPISSALLSKNAARLAALPPVDVGRSPCIRLQDHSVTPLKVAGSELHVIPGKQTRLPVHLVQTATGRHIYFPLQSGSTVPTHSVIANGQRLTLGTLKSASSLSVPQEVDAEVDIMGTAAITKTLSVHVKRLSPPLVTRSSEPDIISPSPLHPPPKDVVEERRRARRAARLQVLAAVHERRCERYPLVGADIVRHLRVVDQSPPNPAAWRWSGCAACHAIVSARHRRHHRLVATDALQAAVKTPVQLIESLQEVLSRFIVYVPKVNVVAPSLHTSHPPPSRLWRERRTEAQLERRLAPRCHLLHPIIRSFATQFPDPRLIQYDCGKLQVLDKLLRQLKSDHHKVLLFTQMTRMLDVLEAFLNYHGYIYLRLDGTTKVDMRQVLMERFNSDDRIFVFILSTRSGGVGVNLTGADTVIFYDSDWNPTMDAQAQDRCHRIGQTRDVHIYRLVSEMTVEENILKKANQKRMMADLAIEGGNFTTAYFKNQSTIQDLFNVDMTETDANKRMLQKLGGEREKRSTEQTENTGGEKSALGALESALATAEDATDVEAARTASAEAAAELAEFDENIPIEEAPEAETEMSRVEVELENLVQQLKPVERYAMRYVEENEAAWSAEQLAAAEAQIEEQKKEWEINRQAALELEEVRLREGEEDEQLSYNRMPNNEEWLNERSIREMTMWCPPTPPQEKNDVYLDMNLGLLYESVPMLDSQLPPVFVKKELKRSRTAETSNNLDMRRNLKLSRRDDSPISAPRSLFDHPGSALQKMRRDVKMHKYRGLARPLVVSTGVQGTQPVRISVPRDENTPDWTVHEDWALLQAVEQLQELPLNLLVLKAGHLPNWDLVADMVNMVSCTTRSPSQCRSRYELVIIPREEGKIIQEQKKQKKNRGLYKLPLPKTTRALRTSQLNVQDNNSSFTDVYHQRFDNIKTLVLSRKPTPKPLLVNPSLKNPKHFAVLADNGVVYDKPLNPIEIAGRRADRIAKDKKIQAMAAAQAAQSGQAQAGQVAQVAITADQLNAQAQRQLVVAAAAAANKINQVQVPVATPSSSTVTVAVSLASGAVTAAQALGAASSGVVQVSSSAVTQTQNVVVASHASHVQTATKVRPATIPVSLQEMVVAAAGGRSVAGTSTTATVVSVANLTPAQLQAARLGSGSLVTIPTSVVKGVNAVQMAAGTKLTPAQMNLYRQQPLMRPQQRIGVRDATQVKLVQGPGNKVTHLAQVQPVTQAQPKTQYLKGTTALTAKGRTEEVAALMKQQLQRQQKTQSAQQQQTLTAQFLTQVQAGSAQVATLVKTSSGSMQNVTIPLPTIAVPQVKGTLASQLKTTTMAGGQPMRLGLAANYQQLLNKQNRQGKVAQLGKQTVPTQLIVQSQGGTKTVPTINMQHIHQVIKNSQPQHITVAAGQGMTGGGQVVLAKAGSAGGGTLGQRVLPSVAGARQTIQVVPGPIRSVSGVSQVSGSALAGSLKVAGTSQQAFISQVTGIPNIVRQSAGNPVRIQTSASGTPIMAVTVQQQQHSQQSADHGQS